MPDQATGAAPAAPETPIARIKAFLNPQAAPKEAVEGDDAPSGGVAPRTEPADPKAPDEGQAPAPKEPATREDEETEEVEVEDEPEGDAQDEELQLSTVEDLATATGLDLDKILDLSLKTKIDGKEGTARVRDLLKSYQLDGHINAKLAALDTDRKTFEGKRSEAEKAATERLGVLDNGIAVLAKALEGEFASVDWEKLRTENPAQFNALYVQYQHRFAEMQQIARQIEAEKQRTAAAQQAHVKAWTDEQQNLLKAKLPEWNDDKKRATEHASIVEYLKGYGIGKEEFEQVQDHRYSLVLRDAWRWAELQKQKPATLKKVKAAPKLLKPGSQQSREARDVVQRKDAQLKLKRSGKVRDAVPVLKSILGAAPR